MKIVIIGSGNVATHLAQALHHAKLDISQIWSLQLENAQALANKVDAIAINQLVAVDLNADLCILAVKDDAIIEVAEQLVGFKGIIVHTAGSVTIDVLAKSAMKYGVFYPLQTFSKIKEVDFSIIPICLEANNEETLSVLKSVANKLSNQVVEISSVKRKILHLAAVFACNFTNHLYALSADILAKSELDFNLIRPLIAETSLKVQNQLPFDVQTGPAVRDDKATEKKHLQLLEETPHLQEIYKLLSESIKKSR